VLVLAKGDGGAAAEFGVLAVASVLM
jgi:hypothetical protein